MELENLIHKCAVLKLTGALAVDSLERADRDIDLAIRKLKDIRLVIGAEVGLFWKSDWHLGYSTINGEWILYLAEPYTPRNLPVLAGPGWARIAAAKRIGKLLDALTKANRSKASYP